MTGFRVLDDPLARDPDLHDLPPIGPDVPEADRIPDEDEWPSDGDAELWDSAADDGG